MLPAQGTSQTQAGGAAAAPAGAPYAQQGAAQGAAPTGAFIGGPCAAAPTVQFQGRGLAATGIAPIAEGQSDTVTNLWISIQEQGSDAGTVIAAAQAKVTAVVAALEKAGVPRSMIQQPYFNSFGNSQAKQFTAYASIQAQLSSVDQLASASNAVLQVPGVSGYSTSTGFGGQPTPQQVQTAVATAAAQARVMANATAKAAGVNLGNVDSVVTQPPSVCYGGPTPTRVMQVTITYTIK